MNRARGIDRRRFLALGAASLSASVLAACDSQGPWWAQPALRTAERRNEPIERFLMRHTTMDRVAPEARLTDEIPSYFISRTVPVWDPTRRGPWALEVTGAVARPRTLSREELARLPSVTHRVNHYCVEGWTAVMEWTGVRISELARLVGLRPDVEYVDFESFDSGYHESWDLESALHPQTLVAYGSRGEWITPEQGAPARLHSPVKLGYKSVKYLTRVVFLPHRTGGYWSDQGYEWYAGT
ncbi:MAG: molybdopterin-dependent oxidoreductase [Gemmatimonadota bacterium]|nr:molybdopterin-dependent oxidoreductase [Gemmatimonadota bacterium]